MMRRLILWDIDGTLITSRGVGRRVMEEAAAAVAGITEVPSIVMSGIAIVRRSRRSSRNSLRIMASMR